MRATLLALFTAGCATTAANLPVTAYECDRTDRGVKNCAVAATFADIAPCRRWVDFTDRACAYAADEELICRKRAEKPARGLHCEGDPALKSFRVLRAE